MGKLTKVIHQIRVDMSKHGATNSKVVVTIMLLGGCDKFYTLFAVNSSISVALAPSLFLQPTISLRL